MLAIVLLTAAVVVFLVLALPVHLPLDPAKERLSPAEHPLFFPVLAVNIVASSAAMLASILQVRMVVLRRYHQPLYRIACYCYVFAGGLPAAVTAVILSLVWPMGPLTTFREVPVAVLWIAVTAYGFALFARGRTADHRRWMLRSFALTWAVMLNPLLDLWVRPALAASIPTHFAGSQEVYTQAADATRLWLATLITLVAVEWWLDRDLADRSRQHRADRPDDALALPAEPTAHR